MRAVRSAAGPVVVAVTVLSLGTGSGLVADPVGRHPAATGSADRRAPAQHAVLPAEVPPDGLALVAALTAPSPEPAGDVLGPSVTGFAAQSIPQVALDAYRSAAAVLAVADPGCRLDWSVLAAIGRVESDHGRFGGSQAGADGIVRPPIIGIALDGRPGVARIGDSDGGRLDGDAVLDRAVGPMQFIPGTWAAFARDGNGDAVTDPQNVYDAAASAVHYLCAGGGDLSTPQGLRAAVLRYNHSDSYVAMVTSLAAAYASGTVPLAPASGGRAGFVPDGPPVVRAAGPVVRDAPSAEHRGKEPVGAAGSRQPTQNTPTRPTTAQPTTAQPPTAQPTTAQPTTAQPTTEPTSPTTPPSCPTTTPTEGATTGQPTTDRTSGPTTTPTSEPTGDVTKSPTTDPGKTGSPTSPPPGTCDAPVPSRTTTATATDGTTPGAATPTATATSS